ncbi:MAG: MCP four helix bundle domain-containing protein, partial [Bacteroidota bacterium]
MKIGVRIALMGVVLALISVVISVTSINSLDSLNEEIHLISEDRVPKTILANDIIDNVNLVARSVRNMIILDINKEREKVLEQDEHIAEATKNIADRLGKLTETITTPEGIQMLEAVKTARQNLLPEIKKVSELTKQGRDEEAEVILYGEYERLQGEYMEAVTRLIEYQNELVQKASASETEVVESSEMTIYILIGAGILLAFLITWFITRSITAPIRKCMVAAENLGEGNMNVDLETKSKDETGALLRAMDSMRGNIQKMVAELNQIAAAAT